MKARLEVLERQAREMDLPLHARTGRPLRRGSAAGPLRTLSRRQTINPLVLAGLVAMAVVSALAIPSLVGRTPVRIASEPVAARAVEPPRPAALLTATTPARPASPPDAPKLPPVQARTPPRPTAPALSLDMLPVLIVDADAPDAAKPPARKTAAAQRRPETAPRQAVP